MNQTLSIPDVASNNYLATSDSFKMFRIALKQTSSRTDVASDSSEPTSDSFKMFRIALKQSSKVLNVSGTTETIIVKSWMFRKTLKQTSSILDVASERFLNNFRQFRFNLENPESIFENLECFINQWNKHR